MTLSWEAPEEQEGQSVQRYVIYDENNAFTTQNKTKNWLFCNSPGGATASARLYSIIKTAKANNLKIYDYLVWLFENIHILPKTELLPWSSKIPPNIRKG